MKRKSGKKKKKKLLFEGERKKATRETASLYTLGRVAMCVVAQLSYRFYCASAVELKIKKNPVAVAAAVASWKNNMAGGGAYGAY